MPDYLFLIRGCDSDKMSPEQMQQHLQRCMTWIDKTTREGAFKASEPLEKGGKVVHSKNQVVTDGPYAESKDLVSGYVMVKAANLAMATEMARTCPMGESAASVEVREIKELLV
jgi:hypothetical protein